MTYKKLTLSLLIAIIYLSIQTTSAAEYQPYTTFRDGAGVSDDLVLLTYEGERAFFSYDPDDFPEITPSIIENTLLPLFTKTVDNYKLFAHENYIRDDAHPAYTSSGKGSVAIVTRTCGIGCGGDGRSEINGPSFRQQMQGILYNPHNYSYSRDPASMTAWWIGMYELARGTYFEFYDELTYRSYPDGSVNYDYIGNAFPELVTHITLTDMGVSAAQIAAEVLHPIGHFKDRYLDLINNEGVTYMDFHPADGSRVIFDQEDKEKELAPNDVMALLMYEFYLRYGKDALLSFFKILIDKDKRATSNIEAACNLGSAMDMALAQRGLGSGVATQFLVNEFAFPSNCPDFYADAETLTEAQIRPNYVSDQHLHYIYNVPFVSSPPTSVTNQLSVSWVFESLGGDIYRIRNKWNIFEYLNIESGYLESTSVPEGYWSSHWRLVSIGSGNSVEPNNKNVFALQSRWKPDQYVVYRGIHGVRVESTTTADLRTHWQLDEITSHLSAGKLQSYTDSDSQINIESGSIEVSPTEDDWWSARWDFVHQGDGYFRIQNKWLPSEQIHIENGTVDTGTLPYGYVSADWKFVRVATGDPELPNAGQFHVLQNRWKPNLMLGVQNGQLVTMNYDLSNNLGYWLILSF